MSDTATSKVYFCDLNTDGNEHLLHKLKRLIEAAGIRTIDFDRKFTAIKMHFGEYGNLGFLRPNWAKVVVDEVRALGGRPFLTDCNTLYPGRRKNALEHLDLAMENGFTPLSTGCQIIVGDGLTGTDEVEVPVSGGTYIQKARIGRAVMDADILISLTHFKGHIETGFGGAMKNIGMGCGSRAGKMEMHSASGPAISEVKCIGCGKCKRFCAAGAIYYTGKGKEARAHIDYDVCTACGNCIAACPTDAITSNFDAAGAVLDAKIAEYCKAVLAGRPNFHIALAVDVTPKCDCWGGGNDRVIVPNIGMFASFDPVALDHACADAVNAQPANPDSLLGEALASQPHNHGDKPVDYFHAINPNTDWQAQIAHAEEIGLGNSAYELIRI
jgi:uncharacterized Fe-S center protein